MDQEFSDTLKCLMEKNSIKFTKGQLIYLKFKRAMDIVCSFVGLIVLLPVFLLVAIAIKVEDPHGSVIYTQERIGRSGREFKLYKFRSMRMGTP